MGKNAPDAFLIKLLTFFIFIGERMLYISRLSTTLYTKSADEGTIEILGSICYHCQDADSKKWMLCGR